MSKNRVLRRILGPKREKVREEARGNGIKKSFKIATFNKYY
jgi:hypothetical protein